MRTRSGDGAERARRAAQAENLVGALALALGDRMSAAVTAAADHAESDAVALSALHQFLESPRVDQVAAVLGLTSSGTVRLVDRLERAGLVRRSPGDDARATTLRLTPAGARRARAVARARTGVLTDALAVLSPDEHDELGRLAGKVLAAMTRPPGATRWTCRLCDVAACGRPDDRCPVANAAEARYQASLAARTDS